ncbi:MAG: hypothetical protein MJ219_00310 [Mycoplasmoidaceae bacterium]|nr:hypothetical protein [Mycoplasmoidaceae bacterium]
MISKDLEETAQSHGLTLGADASQMQSHDVFNRYKHRLNNKLLINQSPYDFPLRDYAIASKALTIYLDNETEDFKDTINN